MSTCHTSDSNFVEAGNKITFFPSLNFSYGGARDPISNSEIKIA